MRLGPDTETFSAPEDHSWLGSAHAVGTGESITLDGDAFLGTFTDGVIPSGVVLAKKDSDGLYIPYVNPTTEVQSVGLGSASAGTVVVGVDGETTGAIAYNATKATVQAAINALSNVDEEHTITVGGADWPGVMTFTYGGLWAGENMPALVVTPTGLTGGTVAVIEVTAGGTTTPAGEAVARGHLLTTVDLGGTTSGTVGNTPASLMWHGRVIVANLPTGHGLDAYARTDLPQIRYVD